MIIVLTPDSEASPLYSYYLDRGHQWPREYFIIAHPL